MKIANGIHINLTHGDLQPIYNVALDKVKNTSNPAIDSTLHPISCIIASFVEHVQKSGGQLHCSQPERLPYQSVDDE